MANQSFYDKNDIPQFQENICRKTCIMNGKCIEDGQDDHWFLMCPHYHKWKLGYTSFVSEQIQWEHDHFEENETKHKDLVARAKAWGGEQRKLKREAKAKEKTEKIAKGEIKEKTKENKN